MVLEAGGNPNIVNELTGESALELCRSRGDDAGVRLLLAAGGNDTEDNDANFG